LLPEAVAPVDMETKVSVATSIIGDGVPEIPEVPEEPAEPLAPEVPEEPETPEVPEEPS
tara:strand:+ start:440 stop:616 length:177 start_codon:yes stop_codon:yes gene_type:complete